MRSKRVIKRIKNREYKEQNYSIMERKIRQRKRMEVDSGVQSEW